MVKTPGRKRKAFSALESDKEGGDDAASGEVGEDTGGGDGDGDGDGPGSGDGRGGGSEGEGGEGNEDEGQGSTC